MSQSENNLTSAKQAERKQMHVFLVARGGIAKVNMKLNRKFDSDLVIKAMGWLLQEQGQREEGKPPITKLEFKV